MKYMYAFTIEKKLWIFYLSGSGGFYNPWTLSSLKKGRTRKFFALEDINEGQISLIYH